MHYLNENRTVFLLNDGEVFEGTIRHWNDCFFSMPSGWAFETKIAAMRKFAEENGFKFSIKNSSHMRQYIRALEIFSFYYSLPKDVFATEELLHVHSSPAYKMMPFHLAELKRLGWEEIAPGDWIKNTSDPVSEV